MQEHDGASDLGAIGCHYLLRHYSLCRGRVPRAAATAVQISGIAHSASHEEFVGARTPPSPLTSALSRSSGRAAAPVAADPRAEPGGDELRAMRLLAMGQFVRNRLVQSQGSQRGGGGRDVTVSA